MSPDLYAVLQVGRCATRTEIKVAYRKLVARLHVDRFGGGGPALERHQLLNLARDTLTDPELRARYDATRYNGAPPRSAPPRSATPRPAPTFRAAPPRWAWAALYGLMLIVLAAALDGRRKPRQRRRA